MDTIKAFFSKMRAMLLDFQKRPEEGSFHLSPPVARSILPTLSVKKVYYSIYQIVSCTCYFLKLK